MTEEQVKELTLSHRERIFEAQIKQVGLSIEVWQSNDGDQDGYTIELLTEEGGAVMDFLEDSEEALRRAQEIVAHFEALEDEPESSEADGE